MYEQFFYHPPHALKWNKAKEYMADRSLFMGVLIDYPVNFYCFCDADHQAGSH